jgi:uncharacterized protein YdaU (DUF1376 family)
MRARVISDGPYPHEARALMTKRPYMPLYVADYLSATEHLDAAESGAYLHLIMYYWQKGFLPPEDKFLARIARMTDRQWAAAKPTIKAFFREDWTHERIESEIAHAEKKAMARAESGQRGGFAKALKNNDRDVAKANDTPTFSASKTHSKPLPSSSGLGLEEERYPPHGDAHERASDLESRCREIAGDVPAIADPNFTPVADLVGQHGITEADVVAAIEVVVKTRHRLKFWSKLEPWVRRAAKDRIESAMEPTNYARAGPPPVNGHKPNTNLHVVAARKILDELRANENKSED